MSGSVAERKRLIPITAGNLRQSHLYIGKHADFFPEDCVGPSRKRKNSGAATYIEIILDGLNESVTTDIGRDSKSGKPRQFFRGR